MASLIVIVIILVVAGVLIGGFIAISIAITRGHQVRLVIWNVAPDRTAQGTRPLSGSSRRD
jgi:hypothetical protein